MPVIHCGSGHGQHSHMRVHCSWLGAVRKRAVQQRLNYLRQELRDENAIRVWWSLNAVRERAVQSRVNHLQQWLCDEVFRGCSML